MAGDGGSSRAAPTARLAPFVRLPGRRGVLVPAGVLQAAANVVYNDFFLVFAAFWPLVARRSGAAR
jgi:hypothetical protein